MALLLKYRVDSIAQPSDIVTQMDIDRPTFGEFVAFVLDGQRRGVLPDEHWTPIARLCTPCSIRFDVIVEFATLAEDVQYLGNLTDPSASLRLASMWLNRADGPSTADISRKVFGQLSGEQLSGLFEMFRWGLMNCVCDLYLSISFQVRHYVFRV